MWIKDLFQKLFDMDIPMNGLAEHLQDDKVRESLLDVSRLSKEACEKALKAEKTIKKEEIEP